MTADQFRLFIAVLILLGIVLAAVAAFFLFRWWKKVSADSEKRFNSMRADHERQKCRVEARLAESRKRGG